MNGITPTFLRLFQMMSGLVPPKHIGLTDEKTILFLTRRTQKFDNFFKFNNYLFFPLASVLCMYAYLTRTELINALLFGIPNTIVFTLWAHYNVNIISFQILIFHILCSYLNSRINRLNAIAIEIPKSKRFSRIRALLHSYHSIADEINEYNTTYWSKLLFVFWFIFSQIIALFTFFTLQFNGNIPKTNFHLCSHIIYVLLSIVDIHIFFGQLISQ